jgi:hypothetical protein
VQRLWVVSPHDRYQPAHITHLDVTYTTLAGEAERAEVTLDYRLDVAVGSDVTVNYDPSNPGNAELPGWPKVRGNSDWMLVVVGILMSVVAAGRVVFVVRRRSRNRTDAPGVRT